LAIEDLRSDPKPNASAFRFQLQRDQHAQAAAVVQRTDPATHQANGTHSADKRFTYNVPPQCSESGSGYSVIAWTDQPNLAPGPSSNCSAYIYDTSLWYRQAPQVESHPEGPSQRDMGSLAFLSRLAWHIQSANYCTFSGAVEALFLVRSRARGRFRAADVRRSSRPIAVRLFWSGCRYLSARLATSCEAITPHENLSRQLDSASARIMSTFTVGLRFDALERDAVHLVRRHRM